MCCCIRKAIGRVPLMPHIFIYVTNRALKSCMYPVKNQKPNSRVQLPFSCIVEASIHVYPIRKNMILCGICSRPFSYNRLSDASSFEKLNMLHLPSIRIADSHTKKPLMLYVMKPLVN
uniref:Uncharacterized protein n=1 Tax=Helianthus annuus TaxID=4232 RepID=A0A251V405_HELAN